MSNALKRIKPLMGHSYIYQGQKVEIQDWAMDGEQLILETDNPVGQIKLHLAHVPSFLLELEPTNQAAEEALNGVESPRSSTVPAAPSVDVAAMVPTSVLGQINTVLLDSIARIQADPNYIAQAKAINETVQTAVNVAKLQVEGAKLVASTQARGK